MKVKSIPNKLQTLRKMFLLWFVIEKILYFYIHGFNTLSRMSMFLTEWGKLLTTIFLIIMIIRAKKNNQTLFDKFFHICLALEFLITIFFWAVIHNTVEYINFIDRVVTFSEHFFYFIYLLLEFLLNDFFL